MDKLRNEMFSDGYGFVVDYLAEILKELRKEDWTNDYSKFFELSNTITTRDKTAIQKTFAGLCKIIYPDKNYKHEELKELFEFSIESRRRVKLQLQKMDETFEEVDFSYHASGSAKGKEVFTLEEIQYLGKKNIFVEEDEQAEVLKEKNSRKVKLAGKHVEVYDNQKGISYKNLFGDYFEGVQSVTIIDPYIRLPYQIRNLVELINLIASHKQADEIVKVALITNSDENFIVSIR